MRPLQICGVTISEAGSRRKGPSAAKAEVQLEEVLGTSKAAVTVGVMSWRLSARTWIPGISGTVIVQESPLLCHLDQEGREVLGCRVLTNLTREGRSAGRLLHSSPAWSIDRRARCGKSWARRLAAPNRET